VPAQRNKPPAPVQSRVLLNTDLLAIEAWARHGLDTATIAVLLGLDYRAFEDLARSYARMYEKPPIRQGDRHPRCCRIVARIGNIWPRLRR
jgi:hypothetical protein